MKKKYPSNTPEMKTPPIKLKVLCLHTSNNQRLRSAGDNDRRSKRFCSIAVLCVSFTWQIVKTRVIRLRVIEGPNARDQIAFCAFHSFLVEVQTDAGWCWLHTCDACVITTWRLGLRAPLVARSPQKNIFKCNARQPFGSSQFTGYYF